jgi:hypothetical protein
MLSAGKGSGSVHIHISTQSTKHDNIFYRDSELMRMVIDRGECVDVGCAIRFNPPVETIDVVLLGHSTVPLASRMYFHINFSG